MTIFKKDIYRHYYEFHFFEVNTQSILERLKTQFVKSIH